MSGADEILSLEERRRIAMLASDVETLGQLLAPELRYVHSSGSVDTRESLLAKLAARQGAYLHITLDQLTVTRTSEAAIVGGEMRARVQLGEELREIATRYLAVWLQRDGAWQLAAFQGTSLPAG